MLGRVLRTGFRRIAPLLIRQSEQLTTHPHMNTHRLRPLCTPLITTQKNYFSSMEDTEWTDEQLQGIVESNKLVVFMKGTPFAPQCGFSKYVCQILEMHGCTDFLSYNVLDNEVLRSRIKEFSSWPTIPQVYFNGEFIGGFDILLQLHQSGELIEELEKIGHRSALLDIDNGDPKE